MRTLLLITTLLLSSTNIEEKTVGHNIQFFVTKDHRFSPVLPVTMRVEQEEGGIPDGIQTCDAIQRTERDGDIITHRDIVFVCGRGSKFKVTGFMFTPSESK